MLTHPHVTYFLAHELTGLCSGRLAGAAGLSGPLDSLLFWHFALLTELYAFIGAAVGIPIFLNCRVHLYAFLDAFFVLFHGSLVLFVLTGWIWRQTRRLHLLVTALTCMSWFGLGLFYGIGYCPSTDWHWRIKRARGETDLPDSYVKYCLDRLTGVDWDPFLVGIIVILAGVTVLVLSIALNWRDRRLRTGSQAARAP